jgi:multidrug efflux pump subunit AcrA (membrane-fusion protein)
MVLQAKGDELAGKLAATEKRLAQSEAALRAMTGERDGEQVRADAFDARAVQAEAGLAAADARASAVGVAAQQLETRLRQERPNMLRPGISVEHWIWRWPPRRMTMRRSSGETGRRSQPCRTPRTNASQVEMLRAELQTLQVR